MLTKSNLIGAGLAAFCALAQFRLINFVFRAEYSRSVEAEYGVVIGKPHWRIYQSRVLGPYIVQGLSDFFSSQINAHAFFSIVTLAIAGLLAWRLGSRLGGGGTNAALLGFLVFQVSFAFLLSRPWLYAWDYLGVIMFLLFVDFVFAGKRWLWFAGLFAVAIFNRESDFIALWMIVDPISRWVLAKRRGDQPAAFDRSMLAAGLLCGVAGLVVVSTLRRTLLIEEIGPRIFSDAPQVGGHLVALTLMDNLSDIASAFTTYSSQTFVVVPCFY